MILRRAEHGSHGEREHNPSGGWHRWAIGVLAAVGFLISALMALYQWRMVEFIWEPLFHGGSEYILRESAVTRYCLDTFGYPDSFFGAVAYLVEMLLAGMEGQNRWRTTPWIPIGQGLWALGMGATAVLLVLAQAFAFHRWCSLCLVSAGLSLLILPLAVNELWAAIRYLRRRPERVPLWHAFWGTAH